jgi:hypothetical protein
VTSPNRGMYVRATVLASMVLLGTVACGSSDEEPKAAFTPGGSAAPRTQDVKAQVKADYLAYRDVLKKASEGPAPEDPTLKKHAIGAAYRENYTNLSTLRREGLQLRGESRHAVEVLLVDGDKATLRDCEDPGALRFYSVSTGKLAPGQAPGKPGQVRYTLRREGGTWKVTAIKEEGKCA